MSLIVDVIIDQAEFEREAAAAASAAIAELIGKMVQIVIDPIRDAVDKAIRASPEYQSLLVGVLRNLFGLADPQKALNNIVAAVRNSVQVTPSPSGVTVDILRNDLQDVLGVDGAGYMSHSIRNNTDIWVPWLSWLLLEGSRIILVDWVAVVPHTPGATRTGGAVMVQPKKTSRGFAVPPEFSGTIDNNWLTRCLQEAVPAINDLLEEGLKNA